MSAPFEGLLGNSNELKIIQFLLPLGSLEFNISEIARGTGVTRQTLEPVIRKLNKWHVIKIASKHGNANYYVMDGNSGFIEVFEDLNNRLIEQMLGEETLEEIAMCSLEQHIKIQPIETPTYGVKNGWITAAGVAGEDWSNINRSERGNYARA